MFTSASIQHNMCIYWRVYVCVCVCVGVCLWRFKGKLGGWRRVVCNPGFPSVWPLHIDWQLWKTLMSVWDPTSTPPPHSSQHHDNNKHVSHHTPEQSAIRFTVHEILCCFYWRKDLSVIIYRPLPVQAVMSASLQHPQGIRRGESEIDMGEEWGCVLGEKDMRAKYMSLIEKEWASERKGEKTKWRWAKRERGRPCPPSYSSVWWVHQDEWEKVSLFSWACTNGSPRLLSRLPSSPLLYPAASFEHWHLLIKWSTERGKKN